MVVYYGVVTFFTNETKEIKDVYLHLLFRLPFLGYAIWLAIFFGNRRAESKKLEESYKHKEVMARSFVGYKRSIEGLDEEDKSLLKKHMDNLLGAMSEDSSYFLDPEGEKHPISEFFSTPKDKKQKTE